MFHFNNNVWYWEGPHDRVYQEIQKQAANVGEGFGVGPRQATDFWSSSSPTDWETLGFIDFIDAFPWPESLDFKVSEFEWFALLFPWFHQPFNCRNPSGFPGQWVAQGQQNMCLKLTIFTALGSSAAPWGCDVYIWNSINKGAGKRWCNKSDHPCIAMYYGFAYRTTDYSCFFWTSTDQYINSDLPFRLLSWS